MLRPKENEWMVVNTVYVAGEGVDEIYGYKIRNKDLKTRLVKLETVQKLKKQGRLEYNNARELSYVSVAREYEEQVNGLFN